MANSMIDLKNELIEWIENSYDSEALQKMMDLKNTFESNSVFEITEEENLSHDFDEQFAAGMSSDELMENIASHIESIDSEKTSTVSDPQSEYAVKDDFDERFAQGLNSEEARQESKKRVREWWGK